MLIRTGSNFPSFYDPFLDFLQIILRFFIFSLGLEHKLETFTMYDIINNNKEVTQVSETSISFYLIWLRLKNPSVIHKKTTTEFIYIIFLFHNFFPFGYPVWMPIFNTKVCKRSCRWQVLCMPKYYSFSNE